MLERGDNMEIEIIPARPVFTNPIEGKTIKKRVAAYARVSTDNEEQETSFEGQQTYYTNLIKTNPTYEFVGIYADDGISGTMIEKRAEFKRMIKDALDGKIDLILTKSISRFARNTVDTLTTVRALKEKGVEVFFEKEKISSLASSGELMLTILSSLAQEESRSISENVKIGKRWQMKEGKFTFTHTSFLGFKKCDDGYTIDEEGAEIVRTIYRLFLYDGKSYSYIAKYLNEMGKRTARGNEFKVNNILSILTNEKYKGDCILQKTYSADFLTHKMKKNDGVLPQYHLKGCLPQIIRPEEWELAQSEVERRKQMGQGKSISDVFSSKLVCGDCGGFLGRKVWHSNDAYRSYVYMCNHKYEKKRKCDCPTLKEEDIKNSFLKAFSIAKSDESVIEDLEMAINLLSDNKDEEDEITKIDAELQVVAKLVQEHIDKNTKVQQDQKEYQRIYDEFKERYDGLKEKRKATFKKIASRTVAIQHIKEMIDALNKKDLISVVFDERHFNTLIDRGIVLHDGTIEWHFKCGKIIRF